MWYCWGNCCDESATRKPCICAVDGAGGAPTLMQGLSSAGIEEKEALYGSCRVGVLGTNLCSIAKVRGSFAGVTWGVMDKSVQVILGDATGAHAIWLTADCVGIAGDAVWFSSNAFLNHVPAAEMTEPSVEGRRESTLQREVMSGLPAPMSIAPSMSSISAAAAAFNCDTATVTDPGGGGMADPIMASSTAAAASLSSLGQAGNFDGW